MFKNRSVSTDHFAMVPRADIPRSSFKMETAHKTTFDAGWLVPFYVDEVLPGDTFNLSTTTFARMTTPIFPLMDNLYLDTFYFFVPNRLLWSNWQKFMGERANPSDSIDYLIPQQNLGTGGPAVGSLADYFGIPTVGQIDPTGAVSVNALPFRAYRLIWNEWFRDQNLQDTLQVSKGDGPDGATLATLLKRGKRHDYFTSALPWVQKGESVMLPLGTQAPVYTTLDTNLVSGAQPALNWKVAGSGAATGSNYMGTTAAGLAQAGAAAMAPGGAAWPTSGATLYPSNLYADLSEATAATINQLRQSFQIQKLLERDARGGTRYTEIVRSHFGVISPDARLQRPEYLGGGSSAISVHSVPQTSGSGDYTGTPQGNLAAFAQGTGHFGFTQSFTEHGYIIGLVSARADLTYQQGIRKMWSRSTRYDFYFPVFANLGEQAILQKEIYATGLPVNDDVVFGYQERWAEYRYHPSRITGLFRSTAAGTLDAWHLAQNFTAPPTLNAQFIQETPPMERILAVDPAPDSAQFYFDSLTSIRAARPMPMFSVPGLVDHF